MKSYPLVTVITNFLNAEKFIDEAIASVFAQTYRNWELLLVDDGSNDSSTEIALRYAQHYPGQVSYLEHPGHENRGASASRNLGISAASGEYIAFLDADDVWFAEKLERQVSILINQPEAAMVYGVTQYWYSWNTDLEGQKDLIIQPGVEPDSLIRPPSLLARFLKDELPIPCPSDVMVRRNATVEVGGFENSFRIIFTDQVFYSKFLLRWPVFVYGENLFKYRKHTDSSVAVVKQSGGWRSARLMYLSWLERYLDDNAITGRQVRRALRHARLKCYFPTFFRLSSRSRIGAHVRYRILILNEALRAVVRRILPVALYRLLRRSQHRLGTRT